MFMEAQRRVKNPCGEEKVRNLLRDRANKMDWGKKQVDNDILISFAVAVIKETKST